MSRSTEEPTVTPDHGLCGLGLLMQLVGGSLAVLLSGLLVLMLLGNPPTRILVWLLAILGGGAASGAIQFTAGRALTSGDGGALGKVRQSVYLAWIQTALAVAFLAGEGRIPLGHSVLIAIAYFGVFPTFLYVVSAVEPYRGLLDGRLPETPDRGAEGLAIYMSLLGSMGVLCTLLVARVMMIGEVLRDVRGVVILVTVVLLLVRSTFHVMAGLRGSTRQDWPVFHAGADRYTLVGNILAAFCGVVWAGLALLTSGPSTSTFVTIAMAVGLLLVWPLVVRKFLEGWSPRRSRTA